jgi:hypothetical protein
MDGSKQLVIVNQKTNWQIFLIDAFGNNWWSDNKMSL